MKLATVRTPTGTAAVRVEDTGFVELGYADVGELLGRPDWRSYAAQAGSDGPRHGLGDADYAPVVPRPEKIFCVGLNYRSHILEMGRELPEYPTLFAKFARCLVGAYDDIVLPAASQALDWEAELAVVVGAPVRDAGPDEARVAIAGYTVLNDVTARDWQQRTLQWLQGKTFEATTPIGPWLVTADDPGEHTGFEIRCEVDGETVQQSSTKDLVFDPVALVSYISTIVTLVPGDVIATGTPGGVGVARDPQRFLSDGAVLTTLVEGVGECRNVCRRQP